VADLSKKVDAERDTIMRLYGEGVHDFLYDEPEASNVSDELLRAGILVLTIDHRPNMETSTASLLSGHGCHLLGASTSYRDVVLVGSDGKGVKAHKFALAGQYVRKYTPISLLMLADLVNPTIPLLPLDYGYDDDQFSPTSIL
jgi:hypothetical protein